MKQASRILTFLVLGFFLGTGSAATGGPDGFGYTFIDSNELAGPTFDWQDISATGTPLGLGDDDHIYPISLPFSFDFYGTAYTDLAVGSNGTVYFEDQYLGLANEAIPGTNSYGVNRFIAGYWDDLNPGAGGEIYHQVLGVAPNRQMIVQWQDVPHFGTTDTVTYQVILIEGNNDILVNYVDPSSEAGVGATTGIQGDASTGLQYGFNTANLTASLAICYSHPLSDNPICNAAAGPAPPPPLAVPTTSFWGLTILVMLLALGGWQAAARRANPV
jgi:hypothetical protein